MPRISELTDGGDLQDGDDIPVERGGSTVRVQRPIAEDPEHATDSGTDAFVSATNTSAPADGAVITRDFQSANTTTTPTLDGKTITTRDDSALWAGAIDGVHELQYASGTDTYLVLDPLPIDEDDMASDSDTAVPTQQSTKAYIDNSVEEYVGFYNGQNGSGTYALGRARSRDGITFGRDTPEDKPLFDPANAASPTRYDDSTLAPCPVQVGDEIYVYFEGYDNTRYNIFLLICDLTGRVRQTIEYPVKENTSGDEAHTVRRPVVRHTPGGSPAFEMWYAASATSQDADVIRYATSADGFTWSPQGTILTLGAGGSFDDSFLDSCQVVFQGGTYYLFYAGQNGSKWQGGYATSASPGSGFAKGNSGNPILTSEGPNALAASADVSVGDTTIQFASGALGFSVDAVIAVHDNSSINAQEYNEVKSVDSDTQITLKYPIAVSNFTTANGVAVSQINSFSVNPTEVWFENGEWHCLATGFQFISGRIMETSAYAKTADLDSGFNWQYGVWPLPINLKRNDWDNRAAENIKRIRVR